MGPVDRTDRTLEMRDPAQQRVQCDETI